MLMQKNCWRHFCCRLQKNPQRGYGSAVLTRTSWVTLLSSPSFMTARKGAFRKLLCKVWLWVRRTFYSLLFFPWTVFHVHSLLFRLDRLELWCLSIIHVATEPRCSNIYLNLNMTTVNNHMRGYSPLNAALMCMLVSVKQLGRTTGWIVAHCLRFWSAMQRHVAPEPRAAGAARSRENYELTQERFLMQQQPWPWR